MRVTSNYFNKLSFGYDKQLNKQLKTELKAHPDRRWATTIETLNNHCNRLETNLRNAEKDKGEKDPHFEDYIDIFSSTKQMLVSLVEATFEHLHFADREYIHYRDEFIKQANQNEDNWRIEICESLTPLISKDIDNIFDKAPIPVVKTVQRHSEETPQQSENRLSKNSHLEEFKPTKKTPK